MIVLHSTALLEAVLDQPGGAWIQGRIREHEVAAPGHQLAEVLVALHRLLGGGHIDQTVCRQAVADVTSLPQQVMTLTSTLVKRADELRDLVPASTGLYVAVAEELSCPLLTSDAGLAGIELPCEVLVPEPFVY